MAVRAKKSTASAAKAKAPKAAAKSAPKTAAKTAAKSTAAGKAGATVTLRQIAAHIAEEHEMPKRQADLVLNNVVDVVVKHLRKGDRVRIGGLGILQVKKRAARMGRNPATGEAIKIKASKKVAFRAAKELKESI
ncbi:MAG: HU family DNA-binding protein [Acetobacteraceae bacterium]|nr:HU family DNA-binding protein [Acetobacteraceae bacterium]